MDVNSFYTIAVAVAFGIIIGVGATLTAIAIWLRSMEREWDT